MPAEALPKRVFEVTLPVAPVPKLRARVTRFGTYTPKKTKAFEELLFWLLRDAKAPLFSGPVWVRVTFVLEAPKRMPKDRIFPTVKPDIDNYFKALTDAANGTLWMDDCQIVHADIVKAYGSPARIELSVGEI